MLKLYLVVVAISCAQLCFSAAITEEPLSSQSEEPGHGREQSEYDRIDPFHKFLLSIPKVDLEKAENLVNNTKNLKNTLFELLFSGTNISKDEHAEIFNFDIDNLSEEDGVKIESNIRNKLTSEETLRIMNKKIKKIKKIPQRQHVNRNTRRSGYFQNVVKDLIVNNLINLIEGDLYSHGIPKGLDLPKNSVSKQSVIDFFNEKVA